MHRTANVNEYSGRYSLMPMLFYTPEQEQFQLQSQSNNQGRDGAAKDQVINQSLQLMKEARSASQSAYEYMTSEDVAREIARIDLPLSTYTQWYWKIDLHNLFHFLRLRVDSHAQWEIQQYGRVMAGMLKHVAPLSYEAWIDYDVSGVSLSRQELNVIQQLVEVLENKDNSAVIGCDPQKSTRVYLTDGDNYGLTKREITELTNKLTIKETPDFDLDLSQAKSPEFFEAKMAEAVPNIKKG